MASNEGVSMPGPFGGLVRYDEEFESKFKLSPVHVLVFAALIALFAVGLKIFF
ncbi:MAG: preprotein translocase subunit Sec61beta [Nanoarchaeota archaeon]